MKRKAIVALVTLGVLSPMLVACSSRPPADEIYLYYKSGAGDNKKFVECIEPGTSGKYPVDDELYALPTSLRTWNIRVAGGGDTDKPIVSGSMPGTSGPGPDVLIEATAEFYLNTDCDVSEENTSGSANSPVVKFWENTGRRKWATVDGDQVGVATNGEDGFQPEGWKNMLLNTLVPSEEKALREESRKYTADELDVNQDGIWTRMERALAPSFYAQLKEKLGGDYFCGVGYQRGRTVDWVEWEFDGFEKVPNPVDPTKTIDRQKFKEVKRTGDCPPVKISITNVDFADNKIKEARAKVFAAKAEAEAKLIAARAELEASEILGRAAANGNYLRLKEIEAELEAARLCAANPNCTLILGGGSGVNVNAGK